jgi:hypothetical protein
MKNLGKEKGEDYSSQIAKESLGSSKRRKKILKQLEDSRKKLKKAEKVMMS